MLEIAKGVLGILTYLVAFAALPAWFWWFTMNVTALFPEYARERANLYMAIGAGWLALTLWLLWHYVLPQWWVEATNKLMG